MSFSCFTPKLFLQDSCRTGVISYICWPVLPGGGGTWVNFCGVCAAGLSEPLPHYSLFCDQL